MMIMTTVFCRTRFEGFHRWPNAPDAVSFLRDRHRHVFHVEVHVEVKHDDRDVEFILLKRNVDGFITRTIEQQDIESWSCEKWASVILAEFDAVKVEVSEDGENGAVVVK